MVVRYGSSPTHPTSTNLDAHLGLLYAYIDCSDRINLCN